MSSEDDIFGRNSCFFFFPSLCVYGNASSRCPPHCGRLWNTCKRLIACYMHAHTHTHCTQRSLGGGTSADLLWNKPGAMIAETRRPGSCMVFLSRVKHCCQKQLCVCARVCPCVCVLLGERGQNISERRMRSEITDNVPSAHGRVYEWHWTTAVRNYCIVIKWLLPHWQPY